MSTPAVTVDGGGRRDGYILWGCPRLVSHTCALAQQPLLVGQAFEQRGIARRKAGVAVLLMSTGKEGKPLSCCGTALGMQGKLGWD